MPRTFADVCKLAHPTDGNARQLRIMVQTRADLHYLATMGEAFGPEARGELGDSLIAAWIEVYNDIGEAQGVARDPVYRDVVSMESLIRCGAQDEIAARKRALLLASEPMPAAGPDTFDEIDHLAHWSEMPGGGR